MGSNWTDQTDARLLELCHANQKIGKNHALCITKDNWREIAKLMGRSVRACQDRFWDRNARDGKKKTYKPRTPTQRAQEHMQSPLKRFDTPLTITALLLGDPLPGRSALDRKLNQQQA